jgi:hypothetical protein
MGIATLLARRTQKIKKLEEAMFDKLHNSLKYTLGRLFGVTALFIANNKDFNKTLADLRAVSNPMPKVRLDFSRIDTGKVIGAAVSLADGIAGIFYMGAAGGAVATGATAAAAIPTVGAAAAAIPATAPAGAGVGASIGAIKGVANVMLAEAMLIAALAKAVVIGAENPRKRKNLAVLTAEENHAWTYAMEFYLEEGYDDGEADELAWNDIKLEFPRLKAYDGIDDKATMKALGQMNPIGYKVMEEWLKAMKKTYKKKGLIPIAFANHVLESEIIQVEQNRELLQNYLTHL